MVLYANTISKSGELERKSILPDTPTPAPTTKPTPNHKKEILPMLDSSTTPNEYVNPVLPKIRVIGTGGTGCNMIALCHDAATKYTKDMDVTYEVFDTSMANLQKVGQRNIQIHLLSSGSEGPSGNGGVRSKNYDSNANQIANIMTDQPEADIYILLGAFSGGSGSMIMPLLLREIAGRGKGVVVMAVIDKSSRLETANTRKSIQSLEGVLDVFAEEYPADEYTSFVNLALFDNKFGRNTVNTELTNQFITLLQALDIKYVEGMDRANILNLITPTRIPDLVDYSGIKQIVIACDKLTHQSSHIPDKITQCVTKLDINSETKTTSQARFFGMNPKYEDKITIVTGLPMPEVLYTDIEDAESTLSKLKNQRTTWKGGVRGVTSRNGIVM